MEKKTLVPLSVFTFPLLMVLILSIDLFPEMVETQIQVVSSTLMVMVQMTKPIQKTIHLVLDMMIMTILSRQLMSFMVMKTVTAQLMKFKHLTSLHPAQLLRTQLQSIQTITNFTMMKTKIANQQLQRLLAILLLAIAFI